MMISTLVNKYCDDNDCVLALGDFDEGSFSYSGCAICQNGLGNNVYTVSVMNKEMTEVIDEINVCFEVLDYLANGEDHEIEE